MKRILIGMTLFGALAACLLLVAYFIWPTRFQYGVYKDKDMETQLRTDRLTGETEIFDPAEGWRSRSKPKKTVPTAAAALRHQLSTLELQSVTGLGGATSYGFFKCSLHNGSPWALTEVYVHVKITSSYGKVKTDSDYRCFLSHPSSGSQQPNEAHEWTTEIVGAAEGYDKTEWELIGALGELPDRTLFTKPIIDLDALPPKTSAGDPDLFNDSPVAVSGDVDLFNETTAPQFDERSSTRTPAELFDDEPASSVSKVTGSNTRPFDWSGLEKPTDAGTRTMTLQEKYDPNP